VSRHPEDASRPVGPALALRGAALAGGGGRTRLHPIDLDVAPGELAVLVGPSGSGKTSLLRLVAGLDSPTAGAVLLDGHPVAGVPPHRRGVGLMFQEPVVYPHLDVRANLRFSARARGVTEPDLAGPFDRLVAGLGLAPLLDRHPGGLSGGERQRVALGRVLLSGARLLLLDEPFARLDVHLRDGVAAVVRDWHRERGLTSVLVTHDPVEASRLADRLGVMEGGRLVQHGPPSRLFAAPATPTVGRLVGMPAMEFLPVRLDVVAGVIGVTVEGASAPAARLSTDDWALRAGRLLLGYRPTAAVVSVTPPDEFADHAMRLTLEAQLIGVADLGRDRRCVYQLIDSGHRVVRVEPADGPVTVGRRVTLQLFLGAVDWFPAEADAAGP
jgi:ABC-type sugar transport system ATPase subunit